MLKSNVFLVIILGKPTGHVLLHLVPPLPPLPRWLRYIPFGWNKIAFTPEYGLPLKKMGLHLKNFMKIKAQDTPDKILNFYGLSIGLEWGVGWGGTDIKCDSRISRKYNTDFWILLVFSWLHGGQIPWWTTKTFLSAGNKLVCYTVVFSVVTQWSSPQTSAENWTTFLSLCVCGLTKKPIMYEKPDNMWAAGC